MQRLSEDPDSHHAFGLACVISASFFKSLAGILVRLVEEADGWQLQFYRQASFLVFILGFLVWRHRGRSLQACLEIGRPGLVAAFSLAIAFVASRPFTTAAIIGATTMAQLGECLDALETKLDDDVLAEIEQQHLRLPNPNKAGAAVSDVRAIADDDDVERGSASHGRRLR